MNEFVRDELSKLRADDSGEYVFVSMKTNGMFKEIKKGFKAACREAGITDFRFHDLRHTTGTRLADAFTIAEILGHQDLRMTKRYTHATDDRKRLAVEKLAQLNNRCQKIVKMEKRQSA